LFLSASQTRTASKPCWLLPALALRPEKPTTQPEFTSMDDATQSLHLGIDVAAESFKAALLADEQIHHKSFRNTTAGFKALLRWLNRLTKNQPLTATQVCLEASGGYEEALALFLYEQGLLVSVVNPRQIKAYGDVQLRRSKSDRADAALIVRFCQREQPQLWQPPSPHQRQLRQLTRALDALKRDRDRLRNRHRRSEGPAQVAHEAVLETLEAQITALDQAIEDHVQAHPDLAADRDLLVSIPGIGAQTAASVLAELGVLERFTSARQVAAYAGLVAQHHSSGTSVHRRSRLSKVGNARLRRALYFPALSALRHNAAVKALGDRLAQAGKAKMTIVGAAMRKLLHICYGVLRSGQCFDESLHIAT